MIREVESSPTDQSGTRAFQTFCHCVWVSGPQFSISTSVELSSAARVLNSTF